MGRGARDNQLLATRTAYGEELTLTPGVIDQSAKKYFSYGQCHALAMTIEDYLGWQAYVVEKDNSITHLVNCLPDGKLIDINGVWKENELASKYSDQDGSATVRAAQKNELEQLPESGWAEPDLTTAVMYLPAIQQLID